LRTSLHESLSKIFGDITKKSNSKNIMIEIDKSQQRTRPLPFCLEFGW